MTYPNNTFSIKSERYSGGSSITVSYKGDKIEVSELREFERIYSDAGNTDSQADYFDYDNYVHIGEDSKQYSQRSESFDACSFCGMKTEYLSINTDDKKGCNVCTQNGTAGNSFKHLPEKWF